MVQSPASAERALRRWARVAWVSAALVVLAGSVVRMTGSGMGCPDWPRCFGLAIPPTHVDQVTWQPGETYGEGRMLVGSDTLWVSTSAHRAEGSFAAERAAGKWEPYTAHDYALFNPFHTWVEFINRLLGAFTGLPVLVLWVLSLRHAIRFGRWRLALWATAVLMALGAVAWLGKRVVDGNLVPHSITWHMLGALAILLLLAAYVADSRRAAPTSPATSVLPGLSLPWLSVAALFALVQLITGTQVREAVDTLLALPTPRTDLMAQLPEWWKGHRTGSWAVLAVHLLWMVPLWRASVGSSLAHSPSRRAVLLATGLLLGQTLTGTAFVFLDMPALLQPLHLMLAMGLLTLDGWLLLRYARFTRSALK